MAKFYPKLGVAAVTIRNTQLKIGSTILVYGKSTPAQTAVVVAMQKDNESIKIAKKGDHIGIKLPFKVKRNDKIFLYNLIK